MLTPGNKKLGGHLIWGFALPSGTARVCPGLTAACRRHCYAARLERYRPAASGRYRRNLAASRRPDFARRVRAVLVAHRVRVVRVYVGGDFYSARYARAWLAVMRRSPRVRFFFYTRAWRVPAIRAVIDAMAGLPNCRAWYSADRDTGVPAAVPPGVRAAWLMADPADRTALTRSQDNCYEDRSPSILRVSSVCTDGEPGRHGPCPPGKGRLHASYDGREMS